MPDEGGTSDAAIRVEGGTATDTPAEVGITGVPHGVDFSPGLADEPAEKLDNPPAANHPDPVAESLARDAATAQSETVKHWSKLATLTTEDGAWFVERTWPTPSTDSGKIPVRQFVGPVCYIRCQYGVTLNLGRYESARVDVSFSAPCYPAEVEETYLYVSEWVAKRVMDERAEIEAMRNASEKSNG
jgi:hypothetical protein